MTKTHDALEIIKQSTGIDADTDADVQHYRRMFEIGQLIYDARKSAGMTQEELAKLIGTQQPVISQLESADYEGHSLTMLDRIAKALGSRVEIKFVAETPGQPVGATAQN